MTTKQFATIIVGLVVVLGAILLQPSAPTVLGGTTRDDIVLDVDSGRLTNGYALTVIGDEASFAGLVNSSGTRTNSITVTGEITLQNCGTKTNVIIPVISGANSAINGDDIAVATSVSVTGIAVGDIAIASWTPGHSTGTLQDLRVSISANASTTDVATVFFTNYRSVTSTVGQAAGTITVCYFN